jgi:prolyl oligopeptidase
MRAAALLIVAALPACGGSRGENGSSAPARPAASPAAGPAEAKPAYPASRRENVVDRIHGVAVPDPYRWLEDAGRPDVQAWMKAQHDAARAYLDRLPGRERIAARLAELSYFDAPGVPVRRGARLFWPRKHKDREKAVLYWKQGDKGAEKQLLDPNAWSADGSTSLGEWRPGPDGRHVVFQRKANNSDEAVLHVIEVSSGRELPDAIPGAKYGHMRWTPDGKGFYYTWIPPVSDRVPVADRPGFAEIRYHALGGDPAADQVAFPATGNPQTFVQGEVTDDGRWLVATVQHGWNSTDLYLRDRRARRASWKPLVAGVDAIFQVTPGGSRLFVRTNEGAPRFRVLAIDPARPARAAWKEVVPESEGTIHGVQVAGGRLVVAYLRDATSSVQLRRADGSRPRDLSIPPLGTVASLSGTWKDDALYFDYSSFTERSIVFRASAASGSVEEWARAALPLDASQIQAEQVRYRSRDGTEVTMFLVHRAGAARNGANPTILYGYGGFSQAMLPTPVAGSSGWPWAAWIEMGGMLAIPNLRGGDELGEAWHQAGMLLRKQNVFDDYIAAARYLIEQRWTSPAHLAAIGRSNGGLLVGAAMTQAPELFRAVVCGVPLLDMVRYHLFGSGKTWIPEYGSAEDARQFQALHAYSPYHRLKPGVAYPSVLLMSADSDDRVDPMHARKFTAALQHATTSGAPVLLRIERHAGHGGADLVKQLVEGGTDAFAFLWHEIGP